MSQWQQKTPQLYCLNGDLSRDTVPELWGRLQSWQPEVNEVEVSLEQVKRIDSAGMVMLIHLIEHAKCSGCHIILSFVPEQLHTLFRLSNIEAVMLEHIKIKKG
ncbi:NTP-binding protein [Vibrio sp. HA2012]|uniref:STAS domain-containing protein n=1 Tax=Vibrio sp. HA2012 TaxID=1971595 RepID=UPI000C2BC160|nr:lipid asymmetry maintenance protein MlaB [Vibrio sp. HA2012]PJC85906.1 NTP-binding protein [Vibrio sp. HA2012]